MGALDPWVNNGSRERVNELFRVWQETGSDGGSGRCGRAAGRLGQMAARLAKACRCSAVASRSDENSLKKTLLNQLRQAWESLLFLQTFLNKHCCVVLPLWHFNGNF